MLSPALTDRDQCRHAGAILGQQHVEGAARGAGVHPFQNHPLGLEAGAQALRRRNKTRAAADHQQRRGIDDGIGQRVRGNSVGGRDRPGLGCLGEDQYGTAMCLAANAKAAVAVALDELAAGGNDGRDIEGDEPYGASWAAVSLSLSSSIIAPLRLTFR